MSAAAKKSKKSSAPNPVIIKPDKNNEQIAKSKKQKAEIEEQNQPEAAAKAENPAEKPEATTKKPVKMRTKIIVVALVLLAAVVLHALLSGNSNKTTGSEISSQSGSKTSGKIKSSVGYTLPDGWGRSLCPSSTKIIYVVPNGVTLNCNANPSAPIKMFADPNNTTDCKQLVVVSVQNIKSHTCKSLYISGRKALKASTTYGVSPTYPVETTVSDYFINTGKTVIAVEYSYTSTNLFQAGFDKLATSAQVKK